MLRIIEFNKAQNESKNYDKFQEKNMESTFANLVYAPAGQTFSIYTALRF